MVRSSWLLGSALVALCSMVTCATATAHHSPAAYDMKQVVTIIGAVTRYQWANPHVYVYIEQAADTGEKVEWEIEAAPPSIMRRVGLGRDTLHIGDVLTVKGYPAKNPQRKDLFPYLIQRGEQTLLSLQDFTKLGAPADAGRAAGLDGQWSMAVNFRTIGISASPPVSKLTAKGAEALKRFDEKTTPTSNCIPSPAPAAIITPELTRITVADGLIYIETEAEGTRRTVHMNGASHEGARFSIQGHSIGRWEGATLVVDTTHFAYHGSGNGGGNGIGAAVPSGAQKHLIERFALSADAKSLTYQFEATDPEYLTEPRKGQVQLAFNPRARFEVEKCDLDVARRFIKE
jgi:hypothetical protein